MDSDQTLNMLWLKGKLNSQHPQVQHYAQHRLCDLMRGPGVSTEIRLNHTCKMLLWFNSPVTEPIHPIVIHEHEDRITGVHPGQSRFLAAAMMGLDWSVRLQTSDAHSDLILKAKKICPYKTKQSVPGFHDSIKRQYWNSACALEQQWSTVSGWEFYQRVRDSVLEQV